MDLFTTSDLPSSSYVNLTSPGSLISSFGLEDDSVDGNDFLHFLQHAQALQVRILPLVYEPRLEGVGQEGATGTVGQSVWNSRMRFAFKRFRQIPGGGMGLSEMLLRKLQYKAATNEIAILSCPAIRDHPNISLFIGIGFEVIKSSPAELVHPVLIYSKATGGDLATFFSESQDIDDDLLLGICGEVVKGLDALHRCNVAHGDIKPANILIWRQSGPPEPSLAVALADFGFSSFANSCDELVRVSRSQPWEAPEWGTGEFTLSDAKKMDLYSFGLLCFWLFFRDQTLAELGLPSSTTVDSAFCRSDPSAIDVIQSLKRNGDSMLQLSLTMLQKRQDMTGETRECLQHVFQLTLTRDPEARDASLKNIMSLLSDVADMEQQQHPAHESRVIVPDGHGSLELEHLFFHLETCDYRVHSYITDRLVQMAGAGGCRPCARNASFQLALCHRLGFGVARSDSECSVWLARSEREEDDLAATLERIRGAEPKTSFIANLSSLGYRNDLTSRYHIDGILGAAIEAYRSTLRARTDALGANHFSTMRLKSTLVQLLSFNDDNKEALKLALECVAKNSGLAGSDLRDMKYTLSRIYLDLGELSKAEEVVNEILRVPLEDGDKSGKATTTRFDQEAHLADILIHQGRYEEAGIRAEKVAQESIRELGPEHPSSLAAKRTLVRAHTGAGDIARALAVSEELFHTQRSARILLQKPSPRLVEDVALLGVLRFQAGQDKGGALDCYKAIQKWISHARENATYAANSINNYAVSLMNRGALKDAQEILEALLRECEKVTGKESAESAMVMGNLAVVFHKQADWARVEPLARRVAEARRATLGRSHPHTIIAMGNYREALLAQGKVVDAVQVAKEEISCVKGSASATTTSIMDTLLSVSTAFESARAFPECLSFLEELKVLLTNRRKMEPDEPWRGTLSAVLLEARSDLELQQEVKARDAIYRLLTGLTVPFREDMSEFIPGLLRLADMCLERGGFKVEAEQTLVGAAIMSRKSRAVTEELRATVDAALSEYFKAGGVGNTAEISFRPSLLRGQPAVEGEDI